MDYLILALILTWLVYNLWQGFHEETRPRIEFLDAGNGLREPICGQCRLRLIALSQKNQNGLAGFFAIVFGLVGVVLLFSSLVGGAVILILALLIGQAGRSTTTRLTCPQCGTRMKQAD